MQGLSGLSGVRKWLGVEFGEHFSPEEWAMLLIAATEALSNCCNGGDGVVSVSGEWHENCLTLAIRGESLERKFSQAVSGWIRGTLRDYTAMLEDEHGRGCALVLDATTEVVLSQGQLELRFTNESLRCFANKARRLIVWCQGRQTLVLEVKDER